MASIVIAAPDDIAFVLETELSTEQRGLLENGGALALWPELVTDGEVTIEWQRDTASGALQTTDSLALPAQLIDGPRLFHQVFITPETADLKGIATSAAFMLVEPETPPTESQLDQVWAELNALVPGIAQVRVTYDPSAESRQVTSWVVTLASSVTLAAGLLAIGIGWIEASGTRRIFESIGAGARVLRSALALTIGILAGGATLAGVAAGLSPAIALYAGTDFGFSANPWLSLLLLGLPVVLAAVAFVLPTKHNAV